MFRLGARAGGLAVLALLGAAPNLMAQWRDGDPIYLIGDNQTPDLDLRQQARATAFRLFANADLAITSMRGVGSFHTSVTNWGPCTNNQVITSCLRTRTLAGGSAFAGFSMSVMWGAPPSQRNKVRDAMIAAGLTATVDSSTGGGYTTLESFAHLPRLEVGSDDGSLGRDFTGVLTTAGDGACTDNSGAANAFVSSGIQMLPQPTCPQTLVGGVFDSDNPISDEGWLADATAKGTAFNWEFWRVSDSNKRLDRFLGNNFNTFGHFSDFYTEMRAAYGKVVPGGTGAPTLEGWPMGLRVRFEAYNFAAPAIASAYYYHMLVINESEALWGVPVDYDSLYVALEHAMAYTGQANSSYFDPRLNAFIGSGSGHNLGCNGATNPVTSPTHACVTGGNRGWGGGGALAAIILKSPIGDVRNKLFTNPASQFFGMGNPTEWDDTITFNHGHMCGFGGCNAGTWAVNERRGFGMLASRSDDVLDGRAPSAVPTDSEYWRTFRNRRWPTRDGLFNTSVPGTVAGQGSWDWDDDGVQDTLWFDTCGGPRNMLDLGVSPVGCVATFADTMPGKQNNRYNNRGGVIGVGPFALAAGDTAGFIIAFVTEPDSIGFVTSVNSTIEAYLTFFLLPEAPPRVTITATDVTSTALTNARRVAIFYNDAPETWVDPFLTKLAQDMTNATAPGVTKNIGGRVYDLFRLKNLNPGLIAAITARAADNFGVLEIYKSCNGGATFTADGDCDGDLARDNAGRSVGTGWRAYATITRGAGGADIANSFVDQNVVPGRTYLYSLVSKSRGAIFDVLDSSGGTVQPFTMVVTDSLQTALSRSTSDPSVVSIYVPSSRDAGSTNASATVVTQQGGSTVPSTVVFAGNAVGGQYTALFGNKIIHQDFNYDPTSGSRDSTRVIVQDTVRGQIPPGAAANYVIAADTFRTTDPAGIPFAGTATSTVTAGGVTTRTFSALGFALVGPNNNPFFSSTNLVGDAATPAALNNRADYPGFGVSANNTLAGTYASEVTIEPDGDTINAANINTFTGQAQWRQETSIRAPLGGGQYEIAWQSDPFGLPRGVTIDFANPANTESEITAALSARPAASTGSTAAATSTVTGIPTASLVAARVPFTVTNQSFNRPVTLAMRARTSNTLLLGDGSDTVRVAIPATEWVPGDTLWFIETVTRDSTIAGVVQLTALGQPITSTKDTVTFSRAIIGCNTPRERCNPVAVLTRGATGYVPFEAGTITRFNYYIGYNRDSRFVFDIQEARRGDTTIAVTRAQLDSIRVVPNPYVGFSAYQPDMNTPLVMFTHLPASGTLRIYSVSGQFLQQIRWTPADLDGTGDLLYNLRTREGTALASGLYIWVITTNVGGQTRTARGKFVVIRARAQ
jgi:hypothetical protein